LQLQAVRVLGLVALWERAASSAALGGSGWALCSACRLHGVAWLLARVL